jgi:hypothetical protein
LIGLCKVIELLASGGVRAFGRYQASARHCVPDGVVDGADGQVAIRIDDVGIKRSAKKLNRGDSQAHDFVIHPDWEDGSCQHHCWMRFVRGFSDTLRKG